jgi:adenine-specific DNA-methyltransferase
LKLARNLLKDDGVIFISIDDGEVHNLRKVCDEVFGEGNFVSNQIWQSRTSISDDHEISMNHNHTIIYAKDHSRLKFYGETLNSSEYQNRDKDDRGPWKLVPLDANKPGGNTFYPILNPNTNTEFWPPEGRSWAINPEQYKKLFDDARIAFGIGGDSAPKKKLFLRERLEKGDTKTPSSVLLTAGTTKDGSKEIVELFSKKKIFSYPKPTSFIQRLIQYGIYTEKEQILLDFFSGSATTAHAVMQLNAEDGGKRKFIMVQIPEATDEKSEAYKAGYKTIAEIGKERIRRAGEKIKEDNADKEGIDDLDIGFRVLKVDSSNMKDVYFSPDNTSQDDMFDMASNIKDDRSDEDLLFMVLLDWGIDLSVKIERSEVAGKTVYFADDNFLAACFEENLDEDFVKALVTENPLKVVLRDSGFASSSVKINVEQIFKQADIEVKVI